MNSRLSPLLLSAFLFSACATPSDSRSASAASALREPFPHSFGNLSVKESGSLCSVSATAPSGSPLNRQQLRFAVERDEGFGGWSSHHFTVSTGASKSLADVQALLGGGLRRAASAPAGAELAKLGDLKFGGEMRLVSRGGGAVEFAYNPALEEGNPKLSASEAAAVAQLLSR